MGSLQESFDFIVIGGGTSGSVTASRLANTASAPRILLVEAGGDNSDLALLSMDLRYTNTVSPGVDWGYTSTPQSGVGQLQVPYARGKGLGGSTTTNFSYWTVGSRHDYDLWSERVGDDCWAWDGKDGVQERFRKIENFRVVQGKENYTSYWDSKALQSHSKSGKVDITYVEVPPYESLEEISLTAAKEVGLQINGDINSGSPIGMAVVPSSCSQDSTRITAATAYLHPKPPNLTIVTKDQVSKIIFKGKRAAGIQTISGRKYSANKEIILSAGVIESPKLLLLSGVGPTSELSKHKLPLVHELKGVGRNFTDHVAVPVTLLLNPDAAYDAAQASFHQICMGWFPLEASTSSSAEFSALSTAAQSGLLNLPAFEILTLNMPFALGGHVPVPTDRFISILVCVMNNQSAGSVTLKSANPTDAPAIDPAYLVHPYDRRVAVNSYRKMLEYANAPSFASRGHIISSAPGLDASDDEILEYWAASILPFLHGCGTCVMGRDGDEERVVDSRFRVDGVDGLRIVDLSVAPVLPNAHTQAAAYLVGETASEKLIAEYHLDG